MNRLNAALADRYRIERELGQGGMATVYLAHDLKHHRQVAIKVLRPELAAVIGAERFLAEIRTTANLQHPHILPLHDSGEAGSFLYYVMPYVEGESLRDRLRREKQLPISDAIRIATEVAGALDYAHRHHVLHRDIKPENILLHDGSALVADFGIALALKTAGGTRMTETGLSLGTPHYMSPEQATAERELDARTDVYALGAVTYEMLTGEPPFTGATTQAVIAKLMTEEPRPPSVVRRAVSDSVELAVLTALAKLPADRFATAAQFADALGKPGAITQGEVARSLSRAVQRRRGRWRRLALGGIAGAALIGSGFLLARLSTRPLSFAAVSMSQKTYASVPIFTARFGPDGQTIVYSAAESGMTPHLFIIRPEYPEPQPLGPDSTHLLAISRDGEMAVLTHAENISHRFFIGTLARMPLGGGAPREVLTDVHEADWSPDGSKLAIARAPPANKDLLEYPVGHQLYESDGMITDIRLSPTADRIAFLEHPNYRDDRGTVGVVDTAGHYSKLTGEYSALEGLDWSTDGRALFFSASVAGELYQVRRLDMGGGEARAFPSPGRLTLQDVSSSGRWLVTLENQPWRMFVRQAGTSADREVSWLDHAGFPILTGDGRLLAFSDQSAGAGANYAVMLRRTDGSAAVRLGPGKPQTISPDQRWVLARLPNPPFEALLYPTGPGEPRQLKWPQLESVAYVEFFPDGSLLVCGNEPHKAARCYRTPQDGGTLTPVTPDSVEGALPAPDGKSILIWRHGRYMLWPVGGTEGRIVPGIRGGDEVMRWSANGRALWVRGPSNLFSSSQPIEIEQVDVATGRRSPLVRIQPPERANISSLLGVSLSDDPRVYSYGGLSSTSQLFVVEGMK